MITSAIRDLEYHAELLSLLKLPPQQDRDAVMILHLGGVFGDKAATLDRFRENYKGLPQEIKNRLVLENDDVSWSVHDLLPLCEELNIPMVLDYHHHNIMFDADQVREGTKDIMQLYPRILATWARKNITPKMHYSESTPSAITKRQRSKHSPRVATLPPCPPTMDLMIEAKDKEQAVFELMRTFKLPGYDTFNDIIPHVRKDDNKPTKPAKPKTPRKKPKGPNSEEIEQDQSQKPAEPFTPSVIADDDVGMGGPEGRVYWPPGMEHWLRPVKKVIKPKSSPDSAEVATPVNKKKMPRAIADTPQQAVKLEDTHLDEETASVASEIAVPMSAKKKVKAKTGSLKKATTHRQKSAKPLTSSNKEGVDEVGNDEEGAEEAVPRRKSKRAKKT